MSKFLSPVARSKDTAAPPEDCLECKLIGSGTMLALSGYFVYLNNTAPKNSPISPRFNTFLAAGFAAAAVVRLLA